MDTKELERLLRNGKGALPCQAIESLKQNHFITHSKIASGPASLDLVLSEECYQIGQPLLMPERGQEVYTMIKNELSAKRHRSTNLFPGKEYIIALQESISLPNEIYGYLNPKSTTGRVFTHCRTLSDGVREYDHLPRNWRGKMWVHVVPKVFPISYVPGVDTLNQIRLIVKNAQLSQFELQSLQRQYSVMKQEQDIPITSDRFRIRGGEKGYMILTLDCVGIDDVVGYRALHCKEPLPIGGVQCADWKKYFEPIKTKKYLRLKKHEYYLLSTKDMISIPPDYAAEVQAVGVQYGDNRWHFAGFIDNGFGFSQENPLFGNTITLEVLANEEMRFKDGQPVANLLFEKVAETPLKLYGGERSNYKIQRGTRLPKQFTM